MNYNNLVVRVLRAQGLQLKNHKSLDIYVSLRTSGKGLQYKSKVDTNTITTSDGNASWDESCEFQLNELENELQVGVCHKGKLGTKESLGTLNFDLTLLPQFQPPKAFRLTKKGNDEKDRGVLYLGFEFSNKMGTSISSFSINTIGGVKEKRLDKLKRKMHLGKKKNKDAMSLASVSLSRKSSFSSVTSALAFSSPSPNQMLRSTAIENNTPTSYMFGNDNIIHENHHHRQIEDHHGSPTELHISTSSPSNTMKTSDSGTGSFDKPQLSPQPSICSMRSEAPTSSPSKGGLRSKMREKAEKWLHVKPGRKNSSDDFHRDSASVANLSMNHDRNSLGIEPTVRHRNSFGAPTPSSGGHHHQNLVNIPLSRPTSIASSSGFASLGSQNVNNMASLVSYWEGKNQDKKEENQENEQSNPEYLLKVVEHLRKELHQKESTIRDLQSYLDKLLSRVIETHPELLQVNPRPKF